MTITIEQYQQKNNKHKRSKTRTRKARTNCNGKVYLLKYLNTWAEMFRSMYCNV